MPGGYLLVSALCEGGRNLLGKARVLHWILASARPSESVAYKASNFG